MKKIRWMPILIVSRRYVYYTMLAFGISIILDHYIFNKVLISNDIPGTLFKSMAFGLFLLFMNAVMFNEREENSNAPGSVEKE
jgi:hypothetical protein